MRVELHNLDDYLTELRASVQAGARIVENAVRFRVDRAPQQSPPVTFDVVYHVTAVVESEGDRYLLDLSAYAGADDHTEGNLATKAANAAKAKLVEAAEALGLSVRHGKIEVI